MKVFFAILLFLASVNAHACKITFDKIGIATWNCPERVEASLPDSRARADLEAAFHTVNPNCLQWCQDNSPSYYCCKNDGGCRVD